MAISQSVPFKYFLLPAKRSTPYSSHPAKRFTHCPPPSS